MDFRLDPREEAFQKQFAEWLERNLPEGWDAATSASQQMFHRFYIYHFNPGWSQSSPSASDPAQGR